MQEWNAGIQKGYRLSPLTFSGKVKNQRKLKTTKKPRTPEIPYRAEMTGDSCLARAVVPRTAAAVDHADTELIGHDGQLETPGFFVLLVSTPQTLFLKSAPFHLTV